MVVITPSEIITTHTSLLGQPIRMNAFFFTKSAVYAVVQNGPKKK